MEDILLLLIAEIANQEEKSENRRILKSLRDQHDPFALEEDVFRKTYNFPKTLCWDLIKELEAHDTQSSSVPFAIRFFAALGFFTNGAHQKCIGTNKTMPLSQATVSRSIDYICKLLVKVKGDLVRFPQNQTECDIIKAGFNKKFKIGGIIGAIGNTDIAIICPSSNVKIASSLYLNKKQYFSVKVQAVCDDELRFLYVNAKAPGSHTTDEIWRSCDLRTKLKDTYDCKKSQWLLGNGNFTFEPWLLTPFSKPSSQQEHMYNERHKSATSVIQHAFAALKLRFKCLQNEPVLHYTHDKVAFIVYASIILHNILQNNRIIMQDVITIQDEDICDNLNMTLDSDCLGEAERVRKSVINSYIN